MNKSVNMSPDNENLRKSSTKIRKLSAQSSSPNLSHSRRSSENKDSSRLKVI